MATRLNIEDATNLCLRAARAVGASEETASSLVASVVQAEAEGLATVGLSHFIDYLDSMVAGRIDGKAEPIIDRPVPALFVADARGGIAHTGFDRAIDAFADAALTFGVSVFASRRAYTCGALGYFTGRLAERGLVAIAATNGPALLAGSGSTRPVFCTNPLSFAAPIAGGPPLVIDQASSATAFVNVRKAGEEGRKIPEGWALDAAGRPTTDPAQAMKGALLAFGGERGANIALMVEILAGGVCGANWSLDAPSIIEGTQNSGSGLLIVALNPAIFDEGFETRLRAQLARLRDDYGVYIPGASRAEAAARASRDGISVSADTVARIESFAARGN